MTNASSMHEIEHSKLVHWDNPEGRDGQGRGMAREVGGGIRVGDTCTTMAAHVNVWQKTPQYCKVISF